MSRPGDPVPSEDARYAGPIGGFVVPGLTGIAASGLLVAAWAVGGGAESVVGPVVLVGGALLLGLIVGNPGNEAVVLVGTLLPGALLLALEPRHGCIARLGPLIFLNVSVGIGLMFLGLILGLIVGRRAGIQPLRRPIAVGVLAAAALLAASAWVAVGARLSSGTVC
jgi:hypothetical protein